MGKIKDVNGKVWFKDYPLLTDEEVNVIGPVNFSLRNITLIDFINKNKPKYITVIDGDFYYSETVPVELLQVEEIKNKDIFGETNKITVKVYSVK